MSNDQDASVKPGGVDVSIFIDADAILGKYPHSLDSDAPTPVESDDIIVITRQGMGHPTEGRDHVRLAAHIGTTLRLREFSPIPGGANSVLLYAFAGRDRGAAAALIAAPRLILADTTRPFPNDQDPAIPDSETTKSFSWQSQILRHGKAAYPMSFMIVDAAGEVQGYFSWTPTLTIKK